LQHLSKIDLNQASAKTIYVYQEEANRDNKRSSIGLSYQYVCYQSSAETNEQKKQEVIKIPSLSKKDIDAFKSSKTEVVGLAGPPTGVQKIEWSYTSHYMASRCDNMPTTVWIWDMTTLELASVLIHTQPVKSFSFCPSSNDLYIVTGCGRVYTWAPLGASVIELPQSGFGNDNVS
jgi:WD40 repeat protein